MFSLFSIDGKGIAKAIVPLIFAAVAAFGLYWLYTKIQSNNAATAEANANATALDAEGGDGEDAAEQQLATLSALFGGGTITGTAAPTLSTTGVTYTAPTGTPASPSQAAPTTSGSSTGNDTVNST